MLNIIPAPMEVRQHDGVISLSTLKDVRFEGLSAATQNLMEAMLAPLFSQSKSEAAQSILVTTYGADASLGDEGYVLAVAAEGVVLRSTDEAGLYWGVQTLLQLIANDRTLPCVTIKDQPRFRWRGLMLDVCRHFFGKAEIFHLLDSMAMHKLNTFHWHLTEDQGWRIEVKKFPRLTDIGAWRKGADGQLTMQDAPPEIRDGVYGGFYTQDDVREIVAYAAARHITVVPEIELPGHALAALAAYPELGCTPGPFEVSNQTGVFHDVYCAGNERTFEFLQSVFDETLPLFPGEYIHIGGDECPKDRWKTCPRCQARIQQEGLKDEHELQSYFIRRIERMLKAHGKRLIGWDEILEGGLAPSAAVMSWRGNKGGIAAAQAGHDVVMSPHSHVYLDYKQAESGEPPAIPHGLLPLETVYEFEPIPPELSPEQAQHVLGLQGNCWTEYMPNIRHVDYMLWPRAAALAEIAWSPRGHRDWADFCCRIRANEARLAKAGVNYRPISQ